MNDDPLLYFYHKELADLRKLAVEFANDHLAIAGQLQKTAENSSDPHIERLIEALALGQARIKQKLQDDNEAFVAHLNQTLYSLPSVIPCLSLICFEPSASFDGQQLISKGSTLENKNNTHPSCVFKTCYDVMLLPITITDAQLISTHPKNQKTPEFSPSLSYLQIKLCSTIPINQLTLTSLRFFLNLPREDAFTLYEMLFNHTLCIAATDSTSDSKPIFLQRDALQRVGFSAAEELLPQQKNSISGLSLLQDFYTLPEKFFFFDIIISSELSNKLDHSAAKQLIFSIYFACENSDLCKKFSAKNLVLYATPIVNLFDLPGEPLPISPGQTEIPLIPDAASRPENIEIYAINHLSVIADQGIIDCYPLYHKKAANNGPCYHPFYRAVDDAHPELGQEVYVSLSHLPQFLQATEAILYSELQCSNRNLPNRLPSREISLQLRHPLPATTTIRQLVAFTSSKYPHLSHKDQNRRFAIDLSFGSLMADEGIFILRNLLNLFNFGASTEVSNALKGLISFTNQQTITAAGWHIAATLIVDIPQSNRTQLYLFGDVLQHFLNYFAPLNTQVGLRIEDRHQLLFHYSQINSNPNESLRGRNG